MSDSEITFTVYDSTQGGYEAQAAEHPIFVQADSMEALEANIKDAVGCHFDELNALPAILLFRGRQRGSAKGEFTVAEDFNDPLPKEIEDLFW